MRCLVLGFRSAALWGPGFNGSGLCVLGLSGFGVYQDALISETAIRNSCQQCSTLYCTVEFAIRTNSHVTKHDSLSHATTRYGNEAQRCSRSKHQHQRASSDSTKYCILLQADALRFAAIANNSTSRDRREPTAYQETAWDVRMVVYLQRGLIKKGFNPNFPQQAEYLRRGSESKESSLHSCRGHPCSRESAASVRCTIWYSSSADASGKVGEWEWWLGAVPGETRPHLEKFLKLNPACI